MSDVQEAVKRANYADLEALPGHLVGEIIDGELFASPRPKPRHSRTTSRLGMELGSPFDRGRGGPGGWIILDEPELHLGPDVVVPDLAGWLREHMPELPEEVGITTPPDWVCEVLSPSTAALDRSHKMPLFLRQGVAHLWLLDPAPQTLEVYRRADDGWVVAGVWHGDAAVRAEPFDAVELELGALWER